jgi:hypothetical protein
MARYELESVGGDENLMARGRGCLEGAALLLAAQAFTGDGVIPSRDSSVRSRSNARRMSMPA